MACFRRLASTATRWTARIEEANFDTRSVPGALGFTVFCFLLPYIEQESLYQQSATCAIPGNVGVVNVFAVINGTCLASHPIAAYRCPDEPSPSGHTGMTATTTDAPTHGRRATMRPITWCSAIRPRRTMPPCKHTEAPKAPRRSRPSATGRSNTIFFTERYATCSLVGVANSCSDIRQPVGGLEHHLEAAVLHERTDAAGAVAATADDAPVDGKLAAMSAVSDSARLAYRLRFQQGAIAARRRNPGLPGRRQRALRRPGHFQRRLGVPLRSARRQYLWEMIGRMKNIALTHPVSFAIAAMLCLAGCGRRSAPLPRTYPVHGKATYENGAPVTAGLVQFQPQSEPSVTTAGVIRNDGSYSLTTMRDGLRAEGAVAGPNRVFDNPGGECPCRSTNGQSENRATGNNCPHGLSHAL